VSSADCGVCFEPKNTVALAEAAKSLMLLDPTDIQRLGENTGSFYDENLSVKAGVDLFSEVFIKVINSKNE